MVAYGERPALDEHREQCRKDAEAGEKQLAALQRQLRDLQLDQQIAQKRHDDLVHVKQAQLQGIAATNAEQEALLMDP